MDLDFSFEITSLSFPPDFKIYVDDHLIEGSQSGEFQEKTKLYYQLIDCDKPLIFIRSVLQKGDNVVIHVKSSNRKGFPKLHKDIYKTDETEHLFIILVNGGLNPLADSMDPTESSFNDPLPPPGSFHIKKDNNGLPTNQSNGSKDDPFRNLDLGGLILHKGSSKKHNPMDGGILDKLKGLFQDNDSYERYKQPPFEGNLTLVKKNGENAEIEVYYATERNLKDSKNPKIIKFGNNRADISLGVCKVNIPKKKRQGEIPRPTWWKFEFKASPDKHMLILESKLLEPKTFFETLQAKVQASKEAFVFVHGFNVSFDKSILQAAQIAHDLNFQGAPIVYSWPSKKKTIGLCC
ncbi:alpha/beta hydrolase [Pedobacter sp. B4-66]|uniref:alpha/beta hydrolase n=1 Tax=Pedobacter sp. B4-66 TaxID=2817280 RepID=UPI001BD9DC9B|nr:alpha/beta hydrolase [Pedobacter sp. B4-66]